MVYLFAWSRTYAPKYLYKQSTRVCICIVQGLTPDRWYLRALKNDPTLAIHQAMRSLTIVSSTNAHHHLITYIKRHITHITHRHDELAVLVEHLLATPRVIGPEGAASQRQQNLALDPQPEQWDDVTGARLSRSERRCQARSVQVGT